MFNRMVLLFLLAFVGSLASADLLIAEQTLNTRPTNTLFDPLKDLSTSFPKSIKLQNGGHLLEFCPDETCDGFVSSPQLSVASLKDIAFLYEYFFSGYIYLDEWRAQQDAKSTAARVLSKPEYQNCKRGSDQETARCVLLSFSRNGRVRLLSIGYDEGHRNEMSRDLTKELTEQTPTAK